MKFIQLTTLFIYFRVLTEYFVKLGLIPNSILFAFTAIAAFLLILINIRAFHFGSVGEGSGAILLLAFIAYDLSRAFLSGEQEYILASIYYSVLLLLIVIFGSTNMVKVDDGNLRAILYLFSFGSLFTALLDYPLGLARVFDETGIARPSGLWVNPNSMSYVCFVTIAAAMSMQMHGRLRTGTAAAICLSSAAAMLLAFSLSGLAALVLVVLGQLVLGGRTARWQVVMIVAFVAVVALALLPGFAANLEARILSFGDESNSLTYRINMALIVLRLVQDPQFLLLGGGFWFEKSVLGEDLHNDYIRLLVAGGLFLTLSFLIWAMAIVVRTGKAAFRDRRRLAIWLALGISLGWGLVDSVFRTNPGSMLLFILCSPQIFQTRRSTLPA